MKPSNGGRTKPRGADRFALEIPRRIDPVEEGAPPEVLEVLTSNICSRGSCFQVDTLLPAGTEVKIEITLPLDHHQGGEGGQRLIKVSGAVVKTSNAVRLETKYVIASQGMKKRA